MASIAAMVRLRESEDTNFANRARMLASRMTRTQRFGPTPGLGRAQTGEEFLAILIDASRRGPISNLVVYGHSGPTGLYMREDRGFYASLPEIAKASPLVSGSGPEREDALRGLGARDLADLRQLIADRHVRFTHDAVIVFTGCSAAGESAVERSGFAARTAETARATVFASVGVTDQSMAGRTSALPVREYSRGMWVRFAPVAPPTRLGSRVLDVLRQLNRDEVSVISAGELAPLPAHSEVPRLHCSCTFPVQTGAVI
jgi:hypothetical protein